MIGEQAVQASLEKRDGCFAVERHIATDRRLGGEIHDLCAGKAIRRYAVFLLQDLDILLDQERI